MDHLFVQKDFYKPLKTYLCNLLAQESSSMTKTIALTVTILSRQIHIPVHYQNRILIVKGHLHFLLIQFYQNFVKLFREF